MEFPKILAFLSLMFASSLQAQTVNTARYCNGQVTQNAGETYFANGQRAQISGENLYPNGVRIVQSGELVYPNSQRMNIAGEDYYMSGQRVVISDDLYYPNGQRVQIGADCFYQTGVKMNACPARVRVEDEIEGVQVTGLLDLKTRQILNREFTLKAPDLTISWKLEKNGTLSDVSSRCDDSLL
jgi:hypothetical protein